VPQQPGAGGVRRGARFGLQDKAEKLGAEMALLQGPGPRMWPLARQAVADRSDLPGQPRLICVVSTAGYG